MRKLYIIGDIDEESYAMFSEQLAELEEENGDEVEIEINSAGGSAMDALAFSSRMRTSPCKFLVRAYGLVGSAAVLVLAAGDHRLMTRESWLYVHEDSAENSGNVTNLEAEAKKLRAFENQWNMLLEFYTKTKAEVWSELHKKDWYITADECVKLGIVDEVF